MLFFYKTGATFGTGITAIKLTALGRPQLLVGIMISFNCIYVNLKNVFVESFRIATTVRGHYAHA